MRTKKISGLDSPPRDQSPDKIKNANRYEYLTIMHQMNLVARGFVSIDFERKILGYNPFEEDLGGTNSPPKEPKVPFYNKRKGS